MPQDLIHRMNCNNLHVPLSRDLKPYRRKRRFFRDVCTNLQSTWRSSYKKNYYIQHPAIGTSDFKPLFSRIPHPWVRYARLHDCACGLVLLTHASQRQFGQNVRVTEEWTTGLFRFQACEFGRKGGRQMFIALRGLSLLVSFK